MLVRYIIGTDGWVEVTTPRGKPHRARRTTGPAPGAEAAPRTRVNMPCAEVVALYEGNPIERGWRVAALAKRHIRFRKIFGARRRRGDERWVGEGESYDVGQKLCQIGRAYPPPPEDACGRCEALDDACPGCARRIVNEEAARHPINRIRRATASKDPREQWRLLYEAELADRHRAARRRQERHQAEAARACSTDPRRAQRRVAGDAGAARCA